MTAVLRQLKPEIARERLIRTLERKGITDTRVLDAFRKVPRHEFVDGAMYAQAYDDNALPIGLGQTISQPYIVALMTQFLELKDMRENEKILEIGTGSGFQAAILAQFSRRVYTIERHRPLGDAARKRLRRLGYENIVCKIGDGTRGWPQYAPFDKIVVTAGAPVVPEELAKQLADDGRMVIPVGTREVQSLEVYSKRNGELAKAAACDVVFVPLVGSGGWKESR
ncbi:MAG: protein-L-isoaspartate(D-aspartate) O-methyltransferase [Chitinivibrionales bacterium]|nr:protein-L-isoaspartate(D-aspartate) O-methyltransferase [Chitinivibrionales bacterium]MBD3396142.1 protein-L-isoaspartate(D-aspartate) O-methyltransferase [Chitinivibrionales bacterium]